MRTIWRFPIEFDNHPVKEIQMEIWMPKDAKILYLRDTCGYPKFWAMVDTKAAQQLRKFKAYRTGIKIAQTSRSYVGTFVKHEKIWHLFEVY